MVYSEFEFLEQRRRSQCEAAIAVLVAKDYRHCCIFKELGMLHYMLLLRPGSVMGCSRLRLCVTKIRVSGTRVRLLRLRCVQNHRIFTMAEKSQVGAGALSSRFAAACYGLSSMRKWRRLLRGSVVGKHDTGASVDNIDNLDTTELILQPVSLVLYNLVANLLYIGLGRASYPVLSAESLITLHVCAETHEPDNIRKTVAIYLDFKCTSYFNSKFHHLFRCLTQSAKPQMP